MCAISAKTSTVVERAPSMVHVEIDPFVSLWLLRQAMVAGIRALAVDGCLRGAFGKRQSRQTVSCDFSSK
jgi:hypothetical protein